MATAHDVAAYIEEKKGRLHSLHLQKLVYYAQACSVVWDSHVLFPERIEAWEQGPVVPELRTDRNSRMPEKKGDPSMLTRQERASIDGMLEFFGRLDEGQLIELTHREMPWRKARRGLAPSDPGNREIDPQDILAYYGPALERGKKAVPEALQRGLAFLLEVPESGVDDLGEPDAVDGEAALRWMETGKDDPWRES